MKKKLTEIVESYRRFNEKVYEPFTGKQRVGVLLCNVMLSLYITLIFILHGFDERVVLVLLQGPLFFFTTYQGFKVFLLKQNKLHISCNKERGKLSWKVFGVVSSIVFVIFTLNLLANYPGGITPDNIDQWQQVQSRNFYNWHPAIHTMIIWLITRVFQVYSFFIGFQILTFSFVSGYMAATLAAWGIKKRWLILFLITIISPISTRNIMLYAWKDTFFTILLLCIATYMINIVLSDGKWLLKWNNVAAIAVISALLIVRQNGFFFSLPLGILIIVCYGRITRNAIYAVVASVLVILGITRVLYPLAEVTHPQSQIYVESVGLPMTILSGVMAHYPDRLDNQTREFMNRMATDEEWRATFIRGSYNSVKWAFGTSQFVNEIPPRDLLLMTLRTIRRAPGASMSEVAALTRLVWNPLSWNVIWLHTSPNATGIVYSEYEIEAMQFVISISKILYGFVSTVIDLLTPSVMLNSIGLHMLLLLLAGAYSVNRNLRSKALFLFIPSVVYNLGTMLLLSGPDFRLFHFNIVITLPLIIALLTKESRQN